MNEAKSADDGAMIRGVRVRDVAALHGLCIELGYDTPSAPLDKRLNDIVSDPNQAAFVAEAADGAVIGYVHVFGRFALETEPCAQIQALVVGRAARRSGAAKNLVAAAEAWSRGRGFSWLSLYCTTSRGEAHAAYPAMGFEAVAEATRFNKQLD